MFILGYGTRVDGARVQQLILEEQSPSACDSVERSRSRSGILSGCKRDDLSEIPIGSNFGILLVRARSRLGAGQHILCYEVRVSHF